MSLYLKISAIILMVVMIVMIFGCGSFIPAPTPPPIDDSLIRKSNTKTTQKSITSDTVFTALMRGYMSVPHTEQKSYFLMVDGYAQKLKFFVAYKAGQSGGFKPVNIDSLLSDKKTSVGATTAHKIIDVVRGDAGLKNQKPTQSQINTMYIGCGRFVNLIYRVKKTTP